MDVLPDELFEATLLQTVDPEPATRDQDQSACWRRRVRVSAVCKRWRRITLGVPAFWAGFCLAPGMKGLPQMLPRWKTLPRRIMSIQEEEDGSKPLAPGCSASLNTSELFDTTVLGEVTVYGHLHGLKDLIHKLTNLTTTAPVLHTLQLFGIHPRRRHMYTPVLLYGAATLTHLTVENCGIGLHMATRKSFVFPNLNTFRLVNAWPTTSVDSILASSRCLQNLYISCSLVEEYVPSFSPGPYPSLKRCHLEGAPNPTSRLFVHIMSAPMPPNLRITFNSTGGSLFSRQISAALHAEVVNAILAHINRAESLSEMLLHLEDEEITLHEPNQPDIVHSAFRLETEALLPSFDVPGLRRLSTNRTIVPFFKEEWCGVFERHPDIETLIIADDHFSFHHLHTPATAANPSGSLLHPKLKKLIFKRRRAVCYRCSDSSDQPVFRPELIEFLTARYAADVPILSVEIMGNTLSQDEINELRRRIPGAGSTEIIFYPKA